VGSGGGTVSWLERSGLRKDACLQPEENSSMSGGPSLYGGFKVAISRSEVAHFPQFSERKGGKGGQGRGTQTFQLIKTKDTRGKETGDTIRVG